MQTIKRGFTHIGFCETSDNGRRAVWIHSTIQRNEICLGADHMPMSVSGDPLGLRLGTIGISLAIDELTGRVIDKRCAERAGFEPV